MKSCLIVLTVFLLASVCLAATVPTGFRDERIATGLLHPTTMEIAPDGRIFILEQAGRIRIVKNGAMLSTPFMTLAVTTGGERGLLGIAFDPNFATNRFFYLYYTHSTPNIHNRLSRFTSNGDVVLAGSEKVILDLEPVTVNYHNAGAIHFGPDGKLYVAVGDDHRNNAGSQSLSNLFGKILRINSDGTVPTDNPFYNSTSGINRAIWALGLRNPFSFAFQPGTGRMFINDVGQEAFEEINEGYAGANFGWRNAEGAANCANFQCPYFTYGHGTGNTLGCAVVGGTFYNPPTQNFPSQYRGNYFFNDHCQTWMRRIDLATKQVHLFATGLKKPVDLKVSSSGHLYYLDRNNGTDGYLGQIQYTSSDAPSISVHPVSRTVAAGQQVSFNVVASGAEPLNYQWQRNSVNIPDATSATFTISSTKNTDDGDLFRCVVTNVFGTATSNAAKLTVTTGGAPNATITAPAAGTLYSAGQTINYSGDGNDSEDGVLPASAFTWQIDFHHDEHLHPFILPTTGSKTGSFTIPTTGETSSNVWYRINLTVKDSNGLTHSTFRDVLPRKAQVTIASSPASGLKIRLDDGTIVTTPYTFLGVVGIRRAIEALTPQVLNNVTWHFYTWSNGGHRNQIISTPATNTTYTAQYSQGGLKATYFNNRDFTGTAVTRIDPEVNFSWATGSPAAGIAADTFSVRWTGVVKPAYSQTYRFYANTDDGVRLWVNGVKLIDRWVNSAAETIGTIALTAGQKYSITMEYYENTASARAILSWSSASQPKQVIPRTRLLTK